MLRLMSVIAAAGAAPAALAARGSVPVSITPQVVDGAPSVTLANGCVSVTLNLLRGSLSHVHGRFECDGNFTLSPNVAPFMPVRNSNGYAALADRIMAGAVSVVITGDGRGHIETGTSFFTRASPLPYTVPSSSPTFGAISVVLTDASTAPRISATLTVALAQDSRTFNVNASTTALTAFNATAVSVVTAWSPASAVGMYSTGVRQGFRMMHGPFIASDMPLEKFYGVGFTGGVTVTGAGGETIREQTVMFAGDFDGRRSGVQVVLAGGVTTDQWIDGFENDGYTLVPAGSAWTTLLDITPNNYDFPSDLEPVGAPTLPVDDLRAIKTAVYANPVGALHSYDYYPETRIMPCINVDGNVCYGPLANFFDPDSFLSISAMLLSFDPAVHEQARGLLETNARFFCNGTNPAVSCEFGQMIHHFVPSCSSGDKSCVCSLNPVNPLVVDCVTYEAISGAVQTGPNIFWTWAALRYAATSGNYSWLNLTLSDIRTSMKFLLDRLDTNVGLFKVPGSLFIDTFIRANYTADTNAAMVLLLDFMADAELWVGNTTGASLYSNTSATVRAAMNKYLMAPSGDHYCTQSDPVPGSPGKVSICTRDFVDYDANLLAVAAGVPASTASANKILARIDSGACTHSRATYVSEIYYDAANCNVGNTGDSAITMGRIGWADALARRAVGDAASAQVFFDQILNPLHTELLDNTFMYERYTCQGTPTHNPYYIEMAEVVAMLIAEGKYGVSFGFNTFTVNPVQGVDSFDWTLGPVGHIGYYGHTSFTASLTYAGSKTFIVKSMQPGSYTVTYGAGKTTVPVGADGVLQFTAQTGAGSTVTATLQ